MTAEAGPEQTGNDPIQEFDPAWGEFVGPVAGTPAEGDVATGSDLDTRIRVGLSEKDLYMGGVGKQGGRTRRRQD